MKTIEEVLQTQEPWPHLGTSDRLYKDWQVVDMLKLYGEEVVDECAKVSDEVGYPGTARKGKDVSEYIQQVKQQIG